MAQTFRDAGTRPTRRVSFTPIYPQRHSIGFDDVLLAEERRLQYGVVDDARPTWPSADTPSSSSSTAWTNEYASRPWHLPGEFHVTNWTKRKLVRLKRRAPPCLKSQIGGRALRRWRAG